MADQKLKRVFSLIAEKRHDAALQSFAEMGRPDLSVHGTLMLARACRALHLFGEEAELFRKLLGDGRPLDSPKAGDYLKAVRLGAQSFARIDSRDEALRTWKLLLERGTPGRADALGYLSAAHQVGLETAREALALNDRLFRSLFPSGEYDFLRGHTGTGIALKPGIYLLGGGNGAGKTETGRFLAATGLKVIDTDVELARFEFMGRWKPVARDFGSDRALARFRWPGPAVETLARQASRRQVPIVLCGWSNNAHAFIDLAVAGVYLTLDMGERLRRLRMREPERWQAGNPEYDTLVDKTGEDNAPAGFEPVRSDAPIVDVCEEILLGFRGARSLAGR